MMTWAEKLEKLKVSALELRCGDQNLIDRFCENEHAEEMVDYLHLDDLGLSREKKSWTLVVFFMIMGNYSCGWATDKFSLLKSLSTGIIDMKMVEEALEVLSFMKIIIFDNKPNTKEKTEILVSNKRIRSIINKGRLSRLNKDQFQAIRMMNHLNESYGQVFLELDFEEIMAQTSEYLKDHKPSFVSKLTSENGCTADNSSFMAYIIADYLTTTGASRNKEHHQIFLNPAIEPEVFSYVDKLVDFEKNGVLEINRNSDCLPIGISFTEKGFITFGLAPINRTKGGLPKEVIVPDKSDSSMDSETKVKDFFRHIPHAEIAEEPLFYNSQLEDDLGIYGKLFSKNDDIFKQNKAIKGRMILMFSGQPGTGKTAAAHQLAKRSNRDLVHVNWQTFRGRYIGESEINMKAILDNVDSISGVGRRAPITLFNEAEALLSQRVEVSNSTDRMENNLVSMLLEWLEKKDPFSIVIFTSNHLNIMDKAFQRRIRHINFTAPDINTRFKIWQQILNAPEATTDLLWELSSYQLKGAEIAAVLASYNLRQLALDDNSFNAGLLHQLCQSQHWMEPQTKIGFR